MPEKSVDLELIMLTMLAIISPIICVFLVRGCSGTLLITVLLTVAMIFPGVWHALYIVGKHHKRQKADRTTSSVQVLQTVPQNSGSGMAPAPIVRVITSPPVTQTIQAAPATQTYQAQPATQTIQASPSPVEQVVVTAPVVPLPAAR